MGSDAPTSAAPARILIGTSGWNYATGKGTWNGVFYPARRPRRFDELAYYAEHFDTVEVNSTFYRMPDPGMSARWIERTPRQFLFSVKLYQKFTHPDMYLARNGVQDWDLSTGDFDQFRHGIDPLAVAGRLAALLIQFPASFRAAPETRAYLDWLLDALRDYPLAVELRHRTWSDEQADTRAQLTAHAATWVLIDEPKFPDSIRQDPRTPEPQNPAPRHARGAPSSSRGGTPEPLVYMRFHGRNAASWWEHAESEDRYNYLYSREQLATFARTAKQAAAPGRRVLMYMNNHFSAKSVANAAVLLNELGAPVPGDYPSEMIARYPELQGVVSTSGLPL
jgi:uncharacterized protein YecE (DUF72 family)